MMPSNMPAVQGANTEAPGPEGHFGMAMMRERAKVGGGRFEVESAPGQGATITVRFPIALLQVGPAEEEQEEEAPAIARSDAASAADASPGTPGTVEPAADGSRRTVRASP